MIAKTNKKAFTLVELMVSILIIAFIAGYAYKIYSNSGETMRHTVSQSQIQSDIRIFLDHLENEMTTCYAFNTIDSDKKLFSFYSFTYSKVKLDDILYDSSGGLQSAGSDSDSKIKVKKIEYSWANGVVTKKRTPGWLYFLQNPMKFEESSSNAFDESDKAMTKDELKDITEFEVKGYSQEYDSSSDNGLKITPVTTDTSSKATFIVLRLHAFKEEPGKMRDEEIDVVTKFYSNVKLVDATNPTHFCTTDNNGNF